MHNNMKHIKLFEQFINENTSGEDVWNHIVGITPEEDDIPWGFQDKIENKNFKATKIDLKKLLKSDPDFKEYYNSGEERYDQDEVDSFDVYNELVVVDGELLDGYSRASRLLRQGEKKANAFVSESFITEKKPAGAPDFYQSDAPEAEGRFRDLSIKDLAAWLIKTRKKDVKKISGSLTQQIVFNRNDDPEYAEKMEKTRQEVYKQLGRTDLMDSKQIDNNMKYIKTFNESKAKPGPDAYETGLDDKEVEDKKDQMKKQAEMDDDDPAAYKEMPGDKEARESGKVKTSKHVKSYHELYGDDEANESVNKSIITEKQLKGLDGIDSKTPLTKISDTQKLNIIQGTGNNISFKVPKGFNRNFWQVFSKGKIKKKKSLSGDIVYYLPGKFIDSPNFKSEKDLINGVDWESVEQTRRFNESFQLDEGTMSDIHQLAGEVKSEDEFVKKFFKEYGAKIKKSSDSVEWVKSLYKDTVDESLVNEDEEKKQSTDRTPLDDDAMETGLKKKAEETGVPIGIIRAVARRGLAAWKSGHRPGATQQQWSYARVNSFLTKQPGTWGGADADLAKEVRDGGHDKKLKKA